MGPSASRHLPLLPYHSPSALHTSCCSEPQLRVSDGVAASRIVNTWELVAG